MDREEEMDDKGWQEEGRKKDKWQRQLYLWVLQKQESDGAPSKSPFQE